MLENKLLKIVNLHWRVVQLFSLVSVCVRKYVCWALLGKDQPVISPFSAEMDSIVLQHLYLKHSFLRILLFYSFVVQLAQFKVKLEVNWRVKKEYPNAKTENQTPTKERNIRIVKYLGPALERR